MMSYELFKVQVKKYRKQLLEFPDLVICDEAHRIQNSKTNVTLSVKQIKTKQRICLTGEPFQNCLGYQIFNEISHSQVSIGAWLISSNLEFLEMKENLIIYLKIPSIMEDV